MPVEDKFARVIVKNYYSNNHFLFELDHKQASKLSSLPASLAFASGCNLKWKTISPSLPSTLKEGEAIEAPEHFTSTREQNLLKLLLLLMETLSHWILKQ